MSTMEALGVAWRAGREATARRRSMRSGTRTTTAARILGAVIEHGLAFLGLSSFVAAALLVAIPLGLAVAGVAFFVLEWRVGE